MTAPIAAGAVASSSPALATAPTDSEPVEPAGSAGSVNDWVHLGKVFRRIGVTDRTSAALWAREHLPERTSR